MKHDGISYQLVWLQASRIWELLLEYSSDSVSEMDYCILNLAWVMYTHAVSYHSYLQVPEDINTAWWLIHDPYKPHVSKLKDLWFVKCRCGWVNFYHNAAHCTGNVHQCLILVHSAPASLDITSGQQGFTSYWGTWRCTNGNVCSWI